MTHPPLQHLSLDETRQRGADARQMGLPFHSDPFYMSTELDLEEWVAKCSAWSDGWVQKDAGRNSTLQERMHLRIWY